MTVAQQRSHAPLSRAEFVGIISMLTATAALATDMMLPAFPSMRESFGLEADSNQVALVVTAFFVGLGLGQPLWGPLSDAVGRKGVLWAGLGVFAVGALGAIFASTLPTLLLWRFVSGFGAAALRAVSQAVVRDVYRGEAMAAVLSYVMAVFIIVPIVAPSLGVAVLQVSSWPAIFAVFALFAAAVSVWLVRLPETHPPDRRLALHLGDIGRGARLVVTNRFTMGLTLAQVAAFGLFTSYLASSQVIVAEVLDLEAWFPLIFGATAAVLGVGVLVNTRPLPRFGLRGVLRAATTVYLLSALTLAVIAWLTDGSPGLALWAVGLVPLLGAHSMLIPDLNSAAMVPMGAVAGTAAAVIGGGSILGGALIGALIDRTFDGSILPFAIAAVISAGCVVVAYWWSDTVWDSSAA